MTSDLDIYRSAKLMIDQHGDDAGLEAAMRADAMLEKGAMAGAAMWRRIYGRTRFEIPFLLRWSATTGSHLEKFS